MIIYLMLQRIVICFFTERKRFYLIYNKAFFNFYAVLIKFNLFFISVKRKFNLVKLFLVLNYH